ncbi:putative dsRNA-binding protein [Candidatus Nardonella dryophthoridicola]|uniref:putative dsRNA-binding protein n=1 Tax=Candidatus Nardonella dryophthoridicola TaxID=1971485 RepID=UPI003B97C697
MEKKFINNKYKFTVICKIQKLLISNYGKAFNKQNAEQLAAKKNLILLKKIYKNEI